MENSLDSALSAVNVIFKIIFKGVSYNNIMYAYDLQAKNLRKHVS